MSEERRGTRIRTSIPFPGYDGPGYVLLDEMLVHVQYTRVDEDGGQRPPAPVSQGITATPGGNLLNFLASSLNRLFASEAYVDGSKVIGYRQPPGTPGCASSRTSRPVYSSATPSSR
jgi:hypothetical protein